MINSYIGKKIHTAYKLFYNHVYLGCLKQKEGLMKKIATAHECSFAIIDDMIPNPIGGFRSSEFVYLLKSIPDSVLFSVIGSKINKRKQFEYYKIQSTQQFKEYRSLFCEEYSLNTNQILPFFEWTVVKPKLAYVVFLSNAYYMVDYFEKHNIKFVLELYPGGGFSIITEGNGYEQLKRVLSSPCLERVLVTQNISYRFLVEQQLCDKDKIEMIYGGILSPILFGLPDKTIQYPVNKNTIDICFSAAKYVPKGLDKGYDIFIDMAHMLLKQSDVFRFHIVGGFDENDIPIEAKYRKHFEFYGYLKGDAFAKFYTDKDIIVAPSRPFTRTKGDFDGFPTTTCAEAGLNGLCMVLSDPLDSNVIYEKGTDAVFAENDAIDFYEKVIHLFRHPEEIYSIGKNGKKAMDKLHCDDQLRFRLSLINSILTNDKRSKAVSASD